MKQFPKRLAALLLAAVMVLSLFPVMGFAADEDAKQPEKDEPFYGYRATPHAGTHALTDAYLRGEGESVNYFNPGQPVNDLPSKYDSRDYNYVTSVKNQNPYGSCWAHAAMASVESYMIKHQIPVGTGAAATTSLNLSETQHCFFNYSSAYDAEGMTTGDKTTLTGGDSCLDNGGNGEMSAYTLMHWTGSAEESVSALTYSNASTVAYSGLNSQYAYDYNISHVQNSVWIPGGNVEAIKQAIVEYGAGNISYYETGSAYTYICTIDNTSTDNPNHKWSNHAITVIGWDDSIPASSFSPNKPSKPGAWICKNSWGTGEFENGYCYISYEDTTVLAGYIYFYDAEPIDNYQHNYQYDGTCNPVCYGKGWSNSIGYYEGFANNTQVANVFTAKSAETLEAIAFCNWDEDLDYTVEIYKNPSVGNPSSGTLMATKSGNLAFSGYYTIKLDEPIVLGAGEKFSVVIKQSCPVADDNGAYIHTPYDATFYNANVVSWASWTHANHGDTSYYKEPNGSWTDCPENGDYRIKAYTNDIQYNIEAIANNDAWGTLTVDKTKIIATPAEGYYVEDYEVVNGEATAVIDVNVIYVTPSSDCTIRVIFAPKPSCTVNFLASGTLHGQETVQIYDVITLPETVNISADGWTFSGWTETRLTEETTEKPVLYLPGGEYMVRGDTTLYAVFTRVEEGAAEIVYELADGLEDGRTYILVAANSISGTTGYAVGNTIVSNNHYLTPVSVTINSDDTCTVSNANLAKVLWNAAGSASQGYSFFNEAVSKYMGLDSAQYLAPSTTALRWRYTASHALDNQVDTEGYYYLSFTTQDGTRYTTSKQEGAINLYRASNPDITYYITEPIVGEHDHDLQYVASKPASCTEPGNIEHWRCTICGHCFSDENGENEITPASAVVIPALGHDYQAVVTEPTCTEGGYTTHTCSRCEDSYTDNQTNALGHNFGAWTETTAPTCTEAGEETRTCSRCPESETRPVNALGHDFGDWTETTAPTCTEAGEKTRTCSRCPESETQPVEALGHDLIHHDGQPATCTEAGWEAYDTCSRCDYTTYAEQAALGHDLVHHEAKPATCTEAGWDAYDTCSRCDYTTYVEIAALDHAWNEGEVTTPATHQAAGEMTYTCTRCEATRTEVIEKLGNPFEDVIEGESYFFDPVMWALDNSVTAGVDDTHFGPAASCTRAQIMTFLWRASGSPEPETTESPFSDVAEGQYFYKAVLWAVDHSITAGMGDGTFGANATCTREQAMAFLWKAKGSEEPETTTSEFSDVTEGQYFFKAVLWAVEHGVTAGMGDGTFGVGKTCVRGQIITFLYRAFNVSAAPKVVNGSFDAGWTCVRGQFIPSILREIEQ